MTHKALTIRQQLEKLELCTLAPEAMHSSKSKGRLKKEPMCDLRTVFQRDRDRIVHCKSFRRLKHKTQVFLAPTGDHYRTRLTHTLEVAQIARTIAKSLRLNEELTEAISLGHDLGHTPFGHAGEEILNQIVEGGFSHHLQSLRVVDEIEKNGEGLNLSFEVRDGIVHHSKGKGPILPEPEDSRPATLEGKIARIADIIAYICHDLDDAIRGGVVSYKKLPEKCTLVLGKKNSERIGTMVRDVVFQTKKADLQKISMSDEVIAAMIELREFLYHNVYEISLVHGEFKRASYIIEQIYKKFREDPKYFEQAAGITLKDNPSERTICDFIAGMTDQYAVNLFERLFLPHPWTVL